MYIARSTSLWIRIAERLAALQKAAAMPSSTLKIDAGAEQCYDDRPGPVQRKEPASEGR